MTLRLYIILMTTFAVISDAILIPFYPQFFASRYGLESPVHVGAYVAAISIAVMCTLPIWARVARRVEPLHLLVYTQCAAGTFSLLSDWAPDVVTYWVLSMLMFMCKSSYLLMYPYMMRLTPKDQHAATVGILSVVVHFGAIFGAVVGGFVLQAWGPRASIVAMAAGDFFQMGVCLYLIRSGKIVRVNSGEHAAVDDPQAPRARWQDRLPILRLALVMLVFDFQRIPDTPVFRGVLAAGVGRRQRVGFRHGICHSGRRRHRCAASACAHPRARRPVARPHTGQPPAWHVGPAAARGASPCADRAWPRAVRLGAVPDHREARGEPVPALHTATLRARLQHHQLLPEPGRAAVFVCGGGDRRSLRTACRFCWPPVASC